MTPGRPRTRLMLCFALALSVVAAAPSAAGQSTRVIMQFASVADRDAAFDQLLDRGAAVRVADTEAGPALVAIGSAALLGADYQRDAGLSRCRRFGYGRQTARARHFRATHARRRECRVRSFPHRSCGGDHRFRHPAASRSAAQPYSRVQGFRRRHRDACGPVRPRHPRGRHHCREWPQLERRLCGHCADRRHRVAAGARRRLLRQHQRRDRRARMDWRQSRALSHQGGQSLAWPRRARVDLHRSAGAGRRAAVAQGRCGCHRRRQ